METTDTWTTVIDAVVQLDTSEGTFSLIIYNADESEAATINIDAVTKRGALLEATAWLKGQGWDPTGTWSWSKEEHVESIRRFRKATS